MLFSATQTRKVEDLARISLKKEPLYVGVDDDKANATVDGLEQVLFVNTFHFKDLLWCFPASVWRILWKANGLMNLIIIPPILCEENGFCCSIISWAKMWGELEGGEAGFKHVTEVTKIQNRLIKNRTLRLSLLMSKIFLSCNNLA